MTESELIAATSKPVTRTAIARQLSQGGLTSGSTVLVHMSLRSLGWVAGGAVAVVQGLMDCVGPQGTLVMPTHTAQLTDPIHWQSPPVPDDWIEILHEEMPAYDPATTPTRSMGAVAELFRTWPGARRSAHPVTSFAAHGPLAEAITANHVLESPLGEDSPLRTLYDLNATVLLIGVDFDVCTLLHLAEQRAWPNRPSEVQGSPIVENGVRRWKMYRTAPTMDSNDFLPVGRALSDRGLVETFKVGEARSMMVSARGAVDYAVRVWRERPPLP